MIDEFAAAQVSRLDQIREDHNRFVLRFMLGMGAFWALAIGALVGVTNYLG